MVIQRRVDEFPEGKISLEGSSSVSETICTTNQRYNGRPSSAGMAVDFTPIRDNAMIGAFCGLRSTLPLPSSVPTQSG
jgi:hypothetical protein